MRPHRNLYQLPSGAPNSRSGLALIFVISAIVLGIFAVGWEIWSAKFSANRVRYLSDTPLPPVPAVVRTVHLTWVPLRKRLGWIPALGIRRNYLPLAR
jgi:hypothetical protein